MRAYIDANVFMLAQYGTGEKGETAAGIIASMQDGKLEGVTCSLAVDELMWAILKQKKGEKLRELVQDVYSLRGLSVVGTPADAPLAALEFIARYGLKPRDAIHSAVMSSLGISVIYSDDADFDRVEWIQRRF